MIFVNIAEYLLSRSTGSDTAFAVVKVDGKLSEDVIYALNKFDEILKIQQLQV